MYMMSSCITHNKHYELSKDVIWLDVIGNKILDELTQEQGLIHSRLYDLTCEARNMNFIFHDMLNSYFSARETMAYFQSKYLRQAQPMMGPHPFSAEWRQRVLSVSMITKKSAGVMEAMLQMQDYTGLQVLDRSLISIGCRKAACDALAHIKRRHLLSGAFGRDHRLFAIPIKKHTCCL